MSSIVAIVLQALTQDIGPRYTSFTGCAILLLSATQKLLMLLAEECSQDLLYASSHLDVLSACSGENEMTRKLYTTLRIIYNDVREIVVSPVYRTMRELHILVKDSTMVPLSYYDAVEGGAEVSKSILNTTRRIMEILQESLSI